MSRRWINWGTGILATTCWLSTSAGADRQLTYDPAARVMIAPAGQAVSAEKRKLQFYDQAGKVTATRELQGNESVTFPVGGGNVIGIMRYHDNSPSTLTPVTFDLSDFSGKQLYRIENPKFSSVVISPTGTAIVGLDGVEGLPQSTLHFFDQGGKEVASLSVEYYQGGQFSGDGSLFVFATAKDGVLAYTAAGKASAGFGQGSVFDLSADGRTVVIWHQGTLRLYVDGKRRASVSTDEQIRALAVSTQGRHFGWASPQRAVVYAVGSDSIVCEITPSLPESNFRSLAISDDGKSFAVGEDVDYGKKVPAEQRHVRGRALAYDFSGRIIAQKDVQYEEWNARIPAVRFLADGETLTVMTRQETHFLQLPIEHTAD